MEGDRLEIYRLSTSWACVWNYKFCWRLASCVHYSKLTLLPIYRECWTLQTELFEMMSLASHFQNNRPLPPLPMTRSLLVGLVEITGDKHLLSLGPAVIISPVFVKAAEWKQAAMKKLARQGGRRGGRYVVISNERLTEAWELDSGGVTCVRAAGSWVRFCFKCRCLGTLRLKHTVIV